MAQQEVSGGSRSEVFASGFRGEADAAVGPRAPVQTMKRALSLRALLALPLIGTAGDDTKADIATSESYPLGDVLPGTNAGDISDIATAITGHNEDTPERGAEPRTRSNALSTAQKGDLIAFLNTL